MEFSRRAYKVFHGIMYALFEIMCRCVFTSMLDFFLMKKNKLRKKTLTMIKKDVFWYSKKVR